MEIYKAGNIIWFILGGFLIVVFYLVYGAFLCLTIIGIPFGIATIKLGIASIAPFGKKITSAKRSGNLLLWIFSVIWILLFGLQVAILHLMLAVLLSITIVGIPFAKQHIKLISVALLPFNYTLKK